MTGLTETSPTPSKQRLRLWLRMLRATRMIEGDMRDLLRREFSTTLPRFDVLSALHRASESGLTMSELSRALMVSNGNVTGIIDRLVDDGFVGRTVSDSDRRTTFVHMTEQGREVFERMAGAHEAWIARRLSGLNEDETQEAICLLDNLRSTAETMKR